MAFRPLRTGPWAWAALALASLPAAAWAAGIAGPSKGTMADFCTELEAVIAEENAREAADFAGSLAQMPETVRSERRVPTAALLTREEAVAVAERLWAMWMPTTPAANVGIVEDGADAWLLGPAPGPEPPYAGAPIRIDKHTAAVTWDLPHPSERERLHDQMCGDGGDGEPPVPPAP
jgi:hypothetical protein